LFNTITTRIKMVSKITTAALFVAGAMAVPYDYVKRQEGCSVSYVVAAPTTSSYVAPATSAAFSAPVATSAAFSAPASSFGGFTSSAAAPVGTSSAFGGFPASSVAASSAPAASSSVPSEGSGDPIDYVQNYNGDAGGFQYDQGAGTFSANWNTNTDFVVGLGWQTGAARYVVIRVHSTLVIS
jgi:hypothetical protein